MSSKPFRGVMCPLLCPLDKDERIIEKDVRRLVRWQLDNGVNALMAPSGTGEFFALRADERKRFVEIVVDEADGEVPVIAMVGDCGTTLALQHLKNAQDAGADGAMAPPVYFCPIDQRGIKLFYTTLAKASDIPLYLYQQPQETKVWMTPETVGELAKIPNIIGIKVSCWGDLLSYHLILRAVRHRADFGIYIGEDHNNLSACALGATGSVSTIANVIPDTVVTLWKAWNRGDLEAARAAQDRMMSVQELLIPPLAVFQTTCKVVLRMKGIFSTDITSSPLQPVTAPERKRIAAIGKKLNLF